MHLVEDPALIAIIMLPEQGVLAETAPLVESFKDDAVSRRRQCEEQGAILN